MQTFTGKQYLQIDIAGNFGLDKSTWQERLTWFKDHEDDLDNLTHLAENPALFYAGVQAYKKAMQGLPSGYPISLDATSSGLQLLAVLTGDRKAAELCNVVRRVGSNGEAKRMDAYTAVYAFMLDLIGGESTITRGMAKDAVMTALYGSKAVPKKVFGEGNLLNLFYETMTELAPGAWELNEAMPSFWQAGALEHSWVLPDNFHTRVKVMDTEAETVHFLNTPYEVTYQVNRGTDEGRSLGANTIHSVDGMVVREMVRRCNYNTERVRTLMDLCYSLMNGGVVCGQMHDDPDSKMVRILWDHFCRTNFLSARIIDHLHAHNIGLVDVERIVELLVSLPSKPFQVMTIHDCFRCLPNYGNDLRHQYNNLLYQLSRSRVLESILSQIVGRKFEIEPLDSKLHEDIKDTEYALS